MSELKESLVIKERAIRPFLSYLTYVAAFLAMQLPVMLYVEHPVGEYVSRNGLLAIIIVLTPLMANNGFDGYKKYLMGVVTMGLVMTCYSYVAYSYHGYSPSGDINNGWLVVSVVYLFISVATASWSVRRFVNKDFRIVRGGSNDEN